ncbi:MAG: heat-inducible transcriptional repressor HrcA, partial [Chloroflexota bacterium]
MLSPRTEAILKSIVGQYIIKAAPVPSHSITNDNELGVSSATIRNEMVHLEHEGYITRPHSSAGGIPLDKGYRCYVASLGDVKFPPAEQRLVSHMFHQVEMELEAWLDLAASLTAQKVQNMALISTPKPEACQFKRLELVSLQESLALVVVVLRGAKVRQQLVTFDQAVSQQELTVIANKLSDTYSGVTGSQILTKKSGLSITEQQVTDCVVKLMEAEDNQEHDDSYIDGLHFTLNQPEFAHNRFLAQTLTELIEQRNLLKSIVPSLPTGKGVHVIIGKENGAESLHNYSVVISRYGLPDEAEGTICVIGPTRMHYARTIATVGYLSLVLSGLVAKLYGGE